MEYNTNIKKLWHGIQHKYKKVVAWNTTQILKNQIIAINTEAKLPKSKVRL